ncbi:MFS transporter [Streptomyces sp. NPDC001700]
MIVVDNTVLHVAVPAVGDAFEASTGQLQAVIDAYVVVFAGLLITAGVLSDRYGRRRTVVVGLLVFGLASALAAAAPTMGWLIAMRALMGVGAALVMPATLAVLVAVFPAEERPRAFAVWSAVASVGMAAGPLLGGALVDAWSWAGVFLINIPVVAVALVGVVRLVPETRAGDGRRLDLPGTDGRSTAVPGPEVFRGELRGGGDDGRDGQHPLHPEPASSTGAGLHRVRDRAGGRAARGGGGKQLL